MNILITSVGTRNKIIKYFRQNINGNIIAADMQPFAPALYEADKYYIVPSITDSEYINTICDICKKEHINAVISLIDPELSLLAANETSFRKLGVKIIGSSHELCELALDKMQMYHWLTGHGYLCPKVYDNTEDFYTDLENNNIKFPVMVKPVKGSASVDISIVNDRDTLDLVWKNKRNMIIQDCFIGREIGVDVYVDMISHEVVSIFTKKKIRMRSGETDKSVSFKDSKLFYLIESFVTECGFIGPIDIDLIEINGKYYIIDVNPRFGGGYPHAYECGCNHMKLIDNNINGIVNEKNIGSYDDGIYMMKYCDVMIKKDLYE